MSLRTERNIDIARCRDMIESTSQIVEGSFRIAWDYLLATDEIGDPEPAVAFLLDQIETMMRRGERRKLMLSNKAIDAYLRARTRQNFALVS